MMMMMMIIIIIIIIIGTLKGCLLGFSPPPQTPQNRNLKNTAFIYFMISKVLRDFPFSRKQPLKSADDRYIRNLKNKLIKLKNRRQYAVIGPWNM
jgi:hypothetical protein